MGKFTDNTFEKIQKIKEFYLAACNGDLEENIHDVRVAIRRIMPNLYFIEKSLQLDEEKEKFSCAKKRLREEFSKFAPLRDYQVSKEILDSIERDSFHNFDVRYVISKEEESLRAKLIASLDFHVLEDITVELEPFVANFSEDGIKEILTDKVKSEKNKFFNLAFALNEKSETEAYHSARIKLKKYRYFKELLYELYEEAGMENFERIKTIQDEFGKLQDYSILKNILAENEASQTYVSFLEFEMEIQKNIILDILRLYLI